MIRTLAAACAVLSLTACSGTKDADEAPPSGDSSVVASVAGSELPLPTAASTGELRIPAALRGRWGLVPADCTSTMGDNKGLITIDAESVKFYESRAVLDVVKEVRESRVVASFNFTGEGQEWKLDQTLELANDGKQLIRTEKGENAMPEPLRYTKCA